MKNFHIIFIILYTSILFLLVSSKTVYSQEYNALAGLESMKSVIDFRKSKPEEVATYLHYCHETYKGLNSFMETEFVIVFTGPVVKFLCTNNENIPVEQRKLQKKIANKVYAMLNDGIRMEICLFAVRLSDMNPDSILPGIEILENGWISLIGYQANQYELLPIY
jgi:intracellular sulfur oxidation DsrE/DsrF family protein